MKKRKILFVTLAVYLMLTFTGCGILERFTSTPEKTVYGFIDALNNSDVNKAVDYIAPSQAKGLKAIISLTGDFIGIDVSAVLDLMPLFRSVSDEYEGELNMDFEITDTEVYEREAWVTGIDYNSGQEMTFYLILEDGRWYIYIDD